uniref:Ig-like domain-containing protein n=1 Tax=Nothobranchius furzeri TaxID=105023 RepID=A0A8C6NLR6_NOTFU
MLSFTVISAGFSEASDVTQSPFVWKQEGEDATMDCSHTKGDLYFQMYWYWQLPGETMRLIVFTSTGISQHDFGDFSKEKFSATKTVAQSGTFTVKNLELKDEGLYFCAVSKHGDAVIFSPLRSKSTYLPVLWAKQECI